MRDIQILATGYDRLGVPVTGRHRTVNERELGDLLAPIARQIRDHRPDVVRTTIDIAWPQLELRPCHSCRDRTGTNVERFNLTCVVCGGTGQVPR